MLSASAAASAQAPSAAADEVVSDELHEYHRHHHHGGVTMFISMAIDTLGLEPAKKAQVEKIQSDLKAKMAPARDAEHDLLSTIADGVAAGKIDTAKADAAVGKVATASAGIHTATTEALMQLHDALAPVERAALVDKVKAHWEVWQKVNEEEKAGSKERGTHLARLTELLGLTPTQVDQIAKALSADVPVTPQTIRRPWMPTCRPSRPHSLLTDSTRRRSPHRPPRRRVTLHGTAARGWRTSSRRSPRC